MDADISQFIGFTGASDEVARRYLGLTENNAEQAIQLFFDSPDLASGLATDSQPAPPPVPNSSRPPRSSSAGRAPQRDSDDQDDTDMDFDDGGDEEEAHKAAAIGRAADFEDDEAIARRMQEEFYAGGDASGGFDADGVRAPMERRTETLVGGPGDWSPDDMQSAVFQQMQNRRAGRSTNECRK